MPETDGTYTIAVLAKLRLHPRVTYTQVSDPAPSCSSGSNNCSA
jgi:hypothetical protein